MALMDSEHDDKLNEKLEKLTRLVEEDHKLIKGMYVRARWTNFFRIVYWGIIILAALGAYVSLQPYIDSFKEAYQSVNQYRTGVTGESGFFQKFFGDVATSSEE
jgi:hypothetical protein